MNWNQHKNIEGSHAFLSPSKCTWLNKTNDELIQAYTNSYAQSIGTMVHAYASDSIRYREKIRKSDSRGVKFDLMRRGIPEFAIDIRSFFPTLMCYVNDSIEYGMDSEIPLYYSDLCYGTADAIQYYDGILRIHDLKTGVVPAKIDQVVIYAALFFHEYKYKPEKTRIKLRIYQNAEIIEYEPEIDEMRRVMKEIVEKDRVLQKLEEV